ncbi:hypothetical protein [Streptomyces sp. TS71-3]|uniref:hypothetical protein n=1 Tax=Streptomyces sp. TS71-3 TaxID=2733862 RepID=UPI001AFCF7E5|nr:hypothetical protein [Streptomyces sp. TS71-3]GHJ42173.1 hypothetical protein Sm713_77820 [Streptomyces sp. TS71-3]
MGAATGVAEVRADPDPGPGFHPGRRYEVIRFDEVPEVPELPEVPEIETILVDHPDQPPLGAGEPPMASWAVPSATPRTPPPGEPLRTLPFTPERVRAAADG